MRCLVLLTVKKARIDPLSLQLILVDTWLACTSLFKQFPITHAIRLSVYLKPHRLSIPKSLHPPSYYYQREDRTLRNITPAFPKGNMALGNIWGKIDFLFLDSLLPQVVTWEVFLECHSDSDLRTLVINVFKKKISKCTLALDVRNKRLALQIVSIYKLTYSLCGSNRRTCI